MSALKVALDMIYELTEKNKKLTEELITLESCKTCEYVGDRGIYCNKLGIMRGGLTYCSHYKEEQC